VGAHENFLELTSELKIKYGNAAIDITVTTEPRTCYVSKWKCHRHGKNMIDSVKVVIKNREMSVHS